ncbi:MAG: GspH/FimT family pseudopilin [Deltaproteobacteria bacterium]|nr:GspH/FimT family pseudopilin [Candidatus Anaeroferrophillus wilburensis]MBN2888884.1 GspH/FimT family pseudopilin [Deltaproteobacteria bacterium]
MNTDFSSRRHAPQAGFTLVELMVTMVVIAVIASLTFAEINSQSYQLKSSANTLKGTMQRARLEAINRNLDVRIDFDPDGDGTVNHGYSMIDADGVTVETISEEKVAFTPSPASLMFTFTPEGTGTAGNITMITTGRPAPEYKITTNNIGRINIEKTK